MERWSSKTKLFCETSFKNETLKLENEAFVRDFLQKWSFEAQSFCARLPSKMKLWRSKTKHFCETSFKNDMFTGHLTSELQYVSAIFKWMLQKYCACHGKVEPRHTNSCNSTRNDHCKVTLPWHEICNPRILRRRLQTSTSQSTKSLRLPRDTHRFGASSNPPRLPRILKRIEIPAPATRKPLWTSKSGPRPWCFNDFDFQIVLARRRGANFGDWNFQKSSEALSF